MNSEKSYKYIKRRPNMNLLIYLNNIIIVSSCSYDGGRFYEIKYNTFREGCYNCSFGNETYNNVFDIKFVALSHNTKRGAALGGILNAELLKAKGFFG